MDILLAEERRSGRSYFSRLVKDLTDWYLPLFLGYWIDSSHWIGGTERRKTLTSSRAELQVRNWKGIKDNMAVLFIQHNQFHYVPDTTPLPPLRRDLTTGRTVALPLAPFLGRVNFLPNGCILSQGYPVDLDLFMYTPYEEGWIQRNIFSKCGPIYLAFDSQSQIYVYQRDQQLLSCLTASGEKISSLSAPLVPVDSFQDLAVVGDIVYFLTTWNLIKFQLSTQTWTILQPPPPTGWVFARKLHTDFHHYLIVETDSFLYFLNLEGQLLRTLSLHLDGVRSRDRQIVLHPNGNFYLTHRNSDQVVRLSLTTD